MDKKELIKSLVSHLKKSKMIDDMVSYINQEIPKTIFPIAKREGLTINEWVSSVEDDERQHTVLTTTRLSYDGVKTYLVYCANKHLSKYDGAKIKVVSLKEIKDVEEVKGIAFDVVFEFNGKLVVIEIKVTQSKDTFTGTTHSTSKSDIFLLISLLINRTKKVVENEKYVDGLFAILLNIDNNKWDGEPSKNSSFTSLNFLSEVDYSDFIIKGSLRNKKKYKEIIFE